MARSFKLVSRGNGPLRQRYRPQRLDEIVPTFSMKEAKAILSDPNASQVYLFEGTTGSGKTTLARIIARASICESEDEDKPCLECEACKTMERARDYYEINVANFRGIDSVRDKISDMCYLSTDLKRKIYIFDEAHQLTPAAQELLNKVLEEPIGDTLIFLCTTNKKGLKKTLLGRCGKLNFKYLRRNQTAAVAKQIVGKDLDKDLIEDLHNKCDGSVRNLLNLLDKVLLGTYEVGAEVTESSGMEGSPNIFKLLNGYLEKDWATVRDLLASDYVKNNPDGYRETICKFLTKRALESDRVNLRIATVLGHLSGSLADEPLVEQFNLLVLRSMRACYKK